MILGWTRLEKIGNKIYHKFYLENKMHDVNILQNLFLPLRDSPEELNLYVKGYNFRCLHDGIEVLPTGEINFNTYFNFFNVYKYYLYTSMDKLIINIEVKYGKGFVYICSNTNNYNKILFRSQISGSICMQLDKSVLTNSSQIFIKFIAIEKTFISNISYGTNISPSKPITLAICITTYNRPVQVHSAYSTLRPLLNNDHHLFIINNGSKPISIASSAVTIIENKNSGGTGGFMRGLHEALTMNQFTHCLFMDDDANCHPESIIKSLKFLEICRNPRESVAGAMLYVGKPNIQYEAGASIDGFYPNPRNIDLDLSLTENVIHNDQVVPPDYGPWWFFLFPISSKLRYSFPFFVRGDDITFSLRNDFRPVMMNGICSWQESFDVKISPTVEYLAFRSFIMLSLVYKDGFDRARVSAHILHRLIKELFGLRYEYNLALQESIKDVLKGPAFWEENVLMEKRLQEIKRLALPHETREHVDGTWNGMIGKKGKILGLLTLGGHLVPSFLQRRTTLSRGRQAAPYGALRSSRIAYFSPENSTFEIFARNKALFFKCLLSSCQHVIKFYLAAPKSRNAYRDSLKKFESSEFWEAYFK